MLQPDQDTFESLANEHDFVPVYRRLLSDRLTPVSAFTILEAGGSACLFESVIGGEKVGRYSILAVDPQKRFAAYGRRVQVTEIDSDGVEHCRDYQSDDPFALLREHLTPSVASVDDLPPFIGGAIGYAGYDVVRYVEHLPDAPLDDRQLPDLDFAFYHTLCVFDNIHKTLTIVSLANGKTPDPRSAREAAAARIADLVERLTESNPPVRPADIAPPPNPCLEVRSNFTRESFCQVVRNCIEYIRAGDIFQVVPSQRFTVETAADPLEIYRSLRVVNPSPFMFFLRTPNCVLVGCSPEIMCRVSNGTVTVRPLAGTRRRGDTPMEDKALEQELLADPKELAEHVMLVDLGRNDVGRIADYRTVELTERMVIERYSHVMHISSEVQGRLRKGIDAFDALKACLPAGTVSGAPKVRAMQIIDSQEPHRRGPYGGAVGYIDYRGNMDTCIALRTMVVQDGVVYVQAGCGVVADSDPDSEFDETVNKAKGLIAAIELTAARLRNT